MNDRLLLAGLAGGAVALALIVPVAWKWQLGVRRVTVFVAIAALLATVGSMFVTDVPLLAGAGVAATTVLLSSVYLLYRFYRDPERKAPSEPGVIVSPADGVVVYIKRSNAQSLPVTTKHARSFGLAELLKTRFYASEAWVIGISMNLLDVHVNRAPVSGVVVFQQHFPGRFGSLRRQECVYENERATTIIRAGDLQVAIVQIASRLVRQIVSYVAVGEELTLGQRVGAIRLGSQVDIVLPVEDTLKLNVQVGDRLTAGETIIGRQQR